MAYTKIRLTAALRAYRTLRNDRGNQTPTSSQPQAASTTYQLRTQIFPEPSARNFRAPIEDSDADDEDFDPAEKKRKKLAADKRAAKRKAIQNPDEHPAKKSKLDPPKSSKPRPSTEEELRNKHAFLTLKITLTESRKALLQQLATDFNTHIDSFRQEHSDIVKHNNMSPREWEAHVRKQTARTAEDQFMDEAKECGSTDGRMLRNRKVVDISNAVRPKKRKADGDEPSGFESSLPTDDLPRPTPTTVKRPKYNHGLQSPSSTPPGRSAVNSSQMQDVQDDDDVIFISSRTPAPTPFQPPRRPTELISTRWVHPMKFLTTEKKCGFCKDHLFGVFGHDERMVTVERIDKGNQVFKEISGGHAAEGKPPTTMCARCSIDRYFMACCGQHRLKRLPGLESDKLGLDKSNMDKYTAQILSGDAGSKKREAGQKICSICPCPASFRCFTLQKKTPTGLSLSAGQELEGCGLLVCKSCKPHLDNNEGVVSKHAFWARWKYGQFQLRADFEFMIEGSLLHRAVQAFTAASIKREGGGDGAGNAGSGAA
jgi:hypothetical protein